MRKLLPLLAVSFLAPTALAQCFDTVYGTPLGATAFGDIVFPIQSIGFAFPFAGATYTDVHVCDKGYVYLSNGGTPAPGFADFTATTAELVSGPPRICALWSDIQVKTTNNGEVYIKSTPNTCTITWVNAQCYQGTSGIFNMQMVLSLSGEIRFLYGPGTTNNSIATQPTWQVGIAGVSPGQGATLPAASDLSAGGATTDNTLFEEWLVGGSFDMADNGLLLVPTTPSGFAFVALGTPTNCAAASSYGTGCTDQRDSLYEQMTATAFDLANTTISYLRQPSGYIALNGVPGTFVPPTGSATVVANADDTEQTVILSSPMPVPGGTTTSLTICSNGRIALSATGNGTAFTPAAQTFLDMPETTIAAAWHDYNPAIAGSGSITFEQVANTAYVTWNNVYSFGTTVGDTFQYQFDLASGSVTVVYGTIGTVGNDRLVGYSRGGPSTTVALDLSTALASTVTVSDTQVDPLSLTSNSSPSLGNAGFTLVTENVPVLVPVGILFFGTAVVNPGIDLTFLGMPTCSGYTNANVGSVSFPVVGTSGSVNIPIPTNPLLINFSFTAQSVAFSLATPANLVTSNGMQLTIGN